MKDEGGRMKGMLFKHEPFIFNSISFILHPPAFILVFRGVTRPAQNATAFWIVEF